MDDKEAQLREEYAELQHKLRSPVVFTQKDYPQLAKRQQELAAIMELFDARRKLLKTKLQAEEMIKGGETELAALAQAELEETNQKIAKNEAIINAALVPKDPND